MILVPSKEEYTCKEKFKSTANRNCKKFISQDQEVWFQEKLF